MRLYLLRHARAETGGNPTPDELRPLTAAGRREAAEVGVWLAARTEPPARVVCSSAVRAVETMEQVLAAMPETPSASITAELYLASAWKIFELLRDIDASADLPLLVVAHNPGVAELAASLSDRGDPAALRSLSRRFLPGSLAEIELPGVAWAELQPAAGTLVSHYVA